jgi:hypothetical protein
VVRRRVVGAIGGFQLCQMLLWSRGQAAQVVWVRGLTPAYGKLQLRHDRQQTLRVCAWVIVCVCVVVCVYAFLRWLMGLLRHANAQERQHQIEGCPIRCTSRVSTGHVHYNSAVLALTLGNHPQRQQASAKIWSKSLEAKMQHLCSNFWN